MAYRGTESPMDFEWQGHGSGPVDASSPFVQHQQQQRQQQQQQQRFGATGAATWSPAMKRTHSQRVDGSKSSLPSLAEPNGRPWFFANMPSLPPQTGTVAETGAGTGTEKESPYRAPSFTTPRKPFDLDFSSGPESSPAGPTETDQTGADDTPEAKPFEFKSAISAVRSGGGKRNSLFGMYGRFAPEATTSTTTTPSGTGKGKPFNDALERRIQQRRRRRAQNFSISKEIVLADAEEDADEDDDEEEEEEVDDDDDDDGDDDETQVSSQLVRRRRGQAQAQASQNPRPRTDPRTRTRKKTKADRKEKERPGTLTNIFTFLTTYPSAPAIIAKYLQILSNVFIFACVFYMLYSALATIRQDIDRLAEESMAEVLAEMSACTKSYIDNQCGAATRLPALETVCSNWELCMNRDPQDVVKRSRLSAHTLADVLNGFVEPISWKTMAVMFSGLFLVLLVTNGTFTIYRRQYEHNHSHNPNPLPSQGQVYSAWQQAQAQAHPQPLPISSWDYSQPGPSQQQQQAGFLEWDNHHRTEEDEGSPSKRFRIMATTTMLPATPSQSPDKKRMRLIQ